MVSVIILAYNRCEEALFTIGKMKAYAATLPFPIEIILVDNASSDNVSEEVRQKFPEVRLIQRAQNTGIAGWNDGFALAQYEFMLVLDDDSHVESGLEEAIAYLQQYPAIGILGMNISGGAFETHDWIAEQPRIGFVGCGAIICKEVYNKIGGFSQWLHVYTHEYDYGIRCVDAGFVVQYFERCKVIHRSSKANRSMERVKTFSLRNEMGIVYKYFGKKERLFYLIRVYINNFKGIRTYGFKSVKWYINALIEYRKLVKTLTYTPVKKETELLFIKEFWSTQSIIRFK